MYMYVYGKWMVGRFICKNVMLLLLLSTQFRERRCSMAFGSLCVSCARSSSIGLPAPAPRVVPNCSVLAVAQH
jgi:hypothetical protein